MRHGQSRMTAADSAGDVLRDGARARRGAFHAAREEHPRFRIDLSRSLKRHRGLALGIALSGIVLAAIYLLMYWPVYSAEARMYIQPAPAVRTSQGVAMQWPFNYDPATYESHVQQQMLSMTSPDVLQNALGKVQDFRKYGESNDHALKRLRQSLQVRRVGSSYEVSINVLTGNAQLSADIANAVAASYLADTAQERQANDAQRMTVLRTELDRVYKQLQVDRAEQAKLRAAPPDQNSEQPVNLLGEISRLQSRYDALDEQIQELSIEDAAPGTAHLAMTAVPPASPIADGVVPTAVLFAALLCVLGLVAAVLAHKLDPHVYVAADVEQLLGFSTIADLPELGEVPEEIFEEQLLRFTAAVDDAIKQGDLKSCVFTGAGLATGVTTIAMRVRSLMEGMGIRALVVDVAGEGQVVLPADARESWSAASGEKPLVLVQRLAEEARQRDDSAVLADAAPLNYSAETEYLARSAGCVVVVVESGVTTRAELRATAKALRRLDARAVGYLLNRVKLANADTEFRELLAATEENTRSKKQKTKKAQVKVRKVEAQPAAAQRPEEEPAGAAEEILTPKETGALTDREPEIAAQRRAVASAPPPEVPQQPARGRMETTPRLQMRLSAKPPASAVPPAEASRRELQDALPWWLTDPFFNADAAARPAQERNAAEPAAPVQPDIEQTESRLSGLRKLFANRKAGSAEPLDRDDTDLRNPRGAAGGVPLPQGSETSPQAQPEIESQKRRGTPMVTTVPEFLPPRKGSEGKRDPDAASRRDRRDTWDDVSVLPSWRGQYRRKE